MDVEKLQCALLCIYDRARTGLKACFDTEENAYLKEEVPIDVKDLVLIEAEVKIVFQGRNFETYNLEAVLMLSDGRTMIGKYQRFENDQMDAIDDSLVFY